MNIFFMGRLNYKYCEMSDEQITRMDFSFWLKQEAKKTSPHPRHIFGDRWRDLTIDRVHPNYIDLVKISRFTKLPITKVFLLAVGAEPILLDDAK